MWQDEAPGPLLLPEVSRERSWGRRYGRYGTVGLLFWPFRVVVYPGKRHRFHPYGYFLRQTASQYSTGNNSSISGTLLRKEGRDAFFHYFFHRYPSVRCCQFTAGHRDYFRPFRADAFSVRPSPYGSRYRLYFFRRHEKRRRQRYPENGNYLDFSIHIRRHCFSAVTGKQYPLFISRFSF